MAQFSDAGHRSIVSEAPFFFAAGFALAPPRGPFGYAKGEQQPIGDAPPFAFVRGSVHTFTPPPVQPIGNHAATGLQLSAEPAPFTFVRAGAPKIITFRPTGRAIANAQAADSAPWSWSTRFLPTASIVPKRPVASSFQAFGAPQWADSGSWAYARGLPANATIPPTTAEILSEAIFRLVNAQLLVLVPLIYQASATIPAGYVIATIPPSGSNVPIGSQVTIIVSSGPAYPFGTVFVPDCVGRNAYHARQKIFDASLSLNSYIWAASNVTAGLVIGQTPAANAPVLPGTLVTLTLSRGPPPPPTPINPIPPATI